MLIIDTISLILFILTLGSLFILALSTILHSFTHAYDMEAMRIKHRISRNLKEVITK